MKIETKKIGAHALIALKSIGGLVKKHLKKITALTIVLTLVGLVVLFRADFNVKSYYNAYIFYTWLVPKAEDGTISDPKLMAFGEYLDGFTPIVIFISNTGEACMFMPSIYPDDPDTDEDDELAGTFNYSAPVLFSVVMGVDKKFDYYTFVVPRVIVDEETGEETLGIDFQLNCFYYNDYLIPDVNNMYVAQQSNHDGDPGDLALFVYPQSFMWRSPFLDKRPQDFRKKDGYYWEVHYNYETKAYERLVDTTNNFPKGAFLENGEIYEFAQSNGDKYVPYGAAYGNYVFSKDLLTVIGKADETVSSAKNISYLYFQGYIPYETTMAKFSLISSTFFLNTGIRNYYDYGTPLITYLSSAASII
ncbi:MAG: hypothetical protein LBQ27_02305 [Clostridiales bacterium]|jgi:hypothetical protein|nr:hypothetical protein [Clostridiales bacterium]